MGKKLFLLLTSLICVFGFMCLSSVNSFAEEDLSDYIEIRTPKDLYKIRSNMEGKYKLMNDIDLTEATAPGGIYDYNGCGWNPIGSNNTYSNTPFTGVLDGQGYKIKGLYMKYSTSQNDYMYFGLFANNE